MFDSRSDYNFLNRSNCEKLSGMSFWCLHIKHGTKFPKFYKRWPSTAPFLRRNDFRIRRYFLNNAKCFLLCHHYIPFILFPSCALVIWAMLVIAIKTAELFAVVFVLLKVQVFILHIYNKLRSFGWLVFVEVFQYFMLWELIDLIQGISHISTVKIQQKKLLMITIKLSTIVIHIS